MKIGSYSIPTNRLGSLLIETSKLYERFNGDETNYEYIAPILGQSPKSGAFYQKMADLRVYGLVAGKRSSITITELGKQATFGDDEEKSKSLEKAVRNIRLWSVLLDKYGTSIESDKFWVILAKITNAERLDAQKKAETVRKAYLDDVRYIKTVSERTKLSQDKQVQEAESTDRKLKMEEIVSEEAVGYIGFPEYSRAPFEIKDESSFEIAQKLLDAIHDAIQKKLTEKATSEEDIHKGKDEESGDTKSEEVDNEDEEVEMLDSEHVEDVDLQEQ